MTTSQQLPSITKTAFLCPHCGAFTSQNWHRVFTNAIDDDTKTPFYPGPDFEEHVQTLRDISAAQRANLIDHANRLRQGNPYLNANEETIYGASAFVNCHISSCYNCSSTTIWVGDKFVYPKEKIGVAPNQDLPEHIQSLFNEARAIAGSSPRGAAALLRLCIQYLCKELGEVGRELDRDIANLVSRGLNPLVQKSLDIVRVIGNESVHPGTIDLSDNNEVCIRLFDLVNLIADQMISHPKLVNELYESLPQAKLRAIEDRNEKAKGGS